MNNKNNSIEFYRFVFAIVICIYHFRMYSSSEYYFASGYLGVEFFLILSGYFVAQSTKNVKFTELEKVCNNSVNYIVKRFLRLYPIYLFSIICISVLRVFFIHNLSIKAVITNGISELFMLQIISKGNVLSLALWFPSALLIASFFIYFLLQVNYTLCTRIIFPIVSLGILSCLLHAHGSLNVTYNSHFIFYGGFWRALAGLMIGCVCYEIVQYVKNSSVFKCSKLFSIIEIILLSVIIGLLWLPSQTKNDFTVLILFCLFIIIIMNQTSTLSNC